MLRRHQQCFFVSGHMMVSFKNIKLVLGFLLLTSFSFGQVEKVHFFNLVEHEGNKIIDSLKLRGVDTIIFYRANFPQAFSTGSGKVVWLEKGIAKTIFIKSYTSKSSDSEERLQLSLEKSKNLKSKKVIDYYLTAHLATITNIPHPVLWKNYDLQHYIFATLQNNVYSFKMTGTTLSFEKTHPLGKLIDLLRK